MQPMGRQRYRFPGKINYNFIKKHFKNWWEDIGCRSKSAVRQEQKKEIQRQLE